MTAKKKSLVIVGNGKVREDYSKFIDSADYVVRFNWLNSYNENTGTKTTAISLATAIQHVNDYIRPVSLFHRSRFGCFSKVLSMVNTVLFPIPDSDRFCFDRLKRIDSLINKFSLGDKIVKKYFCEDVYCYDLIKYNNSSSFVGPSSGYTVIRNILDDDTFQGYDIYIVGFSWEGWEGHPWVGEKAIIHNLINKRKLFIL